MNKKAKMIPTILIAAMLLTACSGQEKADDAKNNSSQKTESESGTTKDESKDSANKTTAGTYTLEKAGTFEDPNRITYSANGALVVDSDYQYKLMNYLGEEGTGETYVEIDNIDYGYYVVSLKSEELNRTGVVDFNGEEILPCDAAIIERLKGDSDTYGSKRYLLVSYAKDVTTNREDAYLYTHASNVISLGVSEGDTMYSGYGKIYDLQEKKFVDNLEITNKDKVLSCGDAICLSRDGKMSLYNSEGSVIYEAEGAFTTYKEGYYKIYENEKYILFDAAGKEVYTSQQQIGVISSTDGGDTYIGEINEDGNKWTILTTEGDVLGEIACDDVLYECNDMLVVVSEDVQYGVYDVNGKELMPYGDTVVNYVKNGYFYRNSSKGNYDNYDVLAPDGTIHKELPAGISYSELLFEKEMDSSGALYVFADKDYTLQVSDYSYDTYPGLAVVVPSTGTTCGLYDVLSGTQLLEAEYEDIMFANQHVYAYKDEVWEVYEIK